jgi:tripartite-type tricarboxylate transporter receptor subunit TctC
LIAPLAAGGGPDLVARTLANGLAVRWKQPVIVDNRPGGDGVVAVRAVIDAADDHTLLFSPNSVVTANVTMHESLAYTAADLDPIASVVDVPIAIVTAAMGPASLADLMEAARNAPGTVTYTSVFGAPQLVWSGMLRHASIEMSQVGYRNPNIALPDLIERRVSVALLPIGTVLGPMRARQVKLIAVLSARRSRVVPDVPSIAEAGYADFATEGGLGLFGATGRLLRREWIAAEVQMVLSNEATANQLLQAGFEVLAAGPEEFAAKLATERSRLARLAPAARADRGR